MPAKIVYTHTDEAPALATYSLLPIVRAFTQPVGIEIEKKDISLAGRILANLQAYLPAERRPLDVLGELGKLAKSPDANIIKLPNISASVPQLTAAIKELQSQGYPLPDYPDEADGDQQRAIREAYAKVLGSAVNPVLREGNSDRRVAAPVKEYARKNPHSMGAWSAESKSHVASMSEGDFFSSEQSVIMPSADAVSIELIAEDGSVTTLKSNLALQAGEVIDAAKLSASKLRQYYADNIANARDSGVLLSLHLKATMMKVSDPILFGHAVSVFFQPVFDKHAAVFEQLGVEPRYGMGDLLSKVETLPEAQRQQVLADIEAVYAQRPRLAMVDSDRGISNLHIPSDVIIDASMPAAIRSSGKMWGPDGELHDMKAMIPDRSYASVYQRTIDFCKQYGAFDPATMGSVANVGLMAQKAEEYGSHDKTFEIPSAGRVCVVNSAGDVLMEHSVEPGDIWRMCQTKDQPIRDWVRLAVRRARATGSPAIFWLDKQRPHDANLITKVRAYLPEHDLDGLEIDIMSPAEATWYSCLRAKNGQDTISVTGNVLRDYLTDLFPILELGTSAKMLSIVPLLAGGGLYETGAGGSAPKHVQQFLAEGHLRWDSLGEFLALGVSLEEQGEKSGQQAVQVLAKALNQAISKFLDTNKSPSRKVNELDSRGSHFYLAWYWAEALANQIEDLQLQASFARIADELAASESQILKEFSEAQGQQVDIGGYYYPDPHKTEAAMRASETMNAILAKLQSK